MSAPAHALDVGPSRYQDELIEKTRASLALVPELHPEGKIIERIEIVRHEVVLPGDPFPLFVDKFHYLTKEETVRQELLFQRGDRWRQDLIDETVRNLRDYLYLSIASITAYQGSRPDTVIALVMTKDLWSLRPGMSLSIVGGTLQKLEFRVAENNFMGRRKTLGLDVGMDPLTFWFGQQYANPRIGESRVSFQERADLIVNQVSGLPEGGIFNVATELPLYARSREWGWRTAIDYNRDVFRIYSGHDLIQVPVPSTGEILPFNYRRQELTASALVTHSTGMDTKQEVSFGWMGIAKNYDPYDPTSTYQPASWAYFSNLYLPMPESAGTLTAKYRIYRTDFRDFMDVDRFALPEQYKLGPDATIQASWADPAFGFTEHYLESKAELSWTFASRDSLLSIGTSGALRYQPELSMNQPWANEQWEAHARAFSSWVGPFRLVGRVYIDRHWNDGTRQIDLLGGGSNLRGFPANYFFGTQSWGANLEARTLPLKIHTFHLGAVAFVDTGDALLDWGQDLAHTSVGGGLRLGIPQFNSSVLRVDFGVPLEALSVNPSYLTVSFGQAF